jgi:hypothetical protein
MNVVNFNLKSFCLDIFIQKLNNSLRNKTLNKLKYWIIFSFYGYNIFVNDINISFIVCHENVIMIVIFSLCFRRFLV